MVEQASRLLRKAFLYYNSSRFSPFHTVSAAQSDLLCEDIRPSLLPGGLQCGIHADLDGRHCHGNRRAQPLLTLRHAWTARCVNEATEMMHLVISPCLRGLVWLRSIVRCTVGTWTQEPVDKLHETWRCSAQTLQRNLLQVTGSPAWTRTSPTHQSAR